MREVTERSRREKKSRTFFAIGLLLFCLFFVGAFFSIHREVQAASAPAIITYQGKLLNNGASVTTTQSMYFVLYDAATSGNVLYTAGGTVGAPAAISVTPTSGLFTVNLGDTGTNSLNPEVFQGNTSVYLEVRVGAETLTPRKQITASPFAYNAKYLDGVGATSAVSSSTYIPISDSRGIFNFNGLTAAASSTFSSLLHVTGNLYVSSTAFFGGSILPGDINSYDIGTSSTQWRYGNFRGGLVVGSGSTTSTFDNTQLIIGQGSGFNLGRFYVDSSGNTAASGTLLATSLITVTDGTNSSALSKSSLSINQSSGFNLGRFYVDSSGNISTSGTLNVAGLIMLSNGFISSASSSIGSSLNVTGNLNASSSLFVSSLSNLLGGFISNASSSIGSSLNVTGNLNASSSFFANGLSNLIGGFISNASSSVGAGLQVAGALNASSSLFVSSSIFLGQAAGFQAGRFNVDATGTISTSGTLQVLAGNYGRPIGSVFQPTLAGVTSSALMSTANSVFVSGNYAYVAAGVADALVIVDVSDPKNPVYVGSVNNGTGGALLDGAANVFVSGNYAYVAAGVSDALEIIDVSNPANPVHKGSISNGSGGALLDQPKSVFVSGNYAYVASEVSDALEIIDVSNPANPVHKSSLSNGAGPTSIDGPVGVYVAGNYAYVASNVSDVLQVVDVSNPANPFPAGRVTNGVGNALLDGPRSVYVSKKYAYVVSDVSDALEIIDISSPTNPVHKGSLTTGLDGALFDDLYSVFVSGDYAYLAGFGSNSLQIVDVSSSTAPIYKGSLSNGVGGALLSAADSVFVSGNYVYATARSSNALNIIDVSGASISNAQIGSLNVDTVQIRNLAQFNQGLLVKDGLSVGGATQLFGDVSIGGGRATTTNMGGGGLTVSVNQTSSTFTSRIFDVSGATGFIFNSGTSTLTANSNRNLVSFQSGGVDKFLFAADGSIVINKTAGTFDLGKFYVDSSGNVSASGTFQTSGLSIFANGFISSASSSIGSNLNITGNLNASSSLFVSSLSNLLGGFISNASSSIGSSLNVTGNLNASSSFFANGLSTLLGGFVSNASSSVGADFQVAGALNASSSLFVSSSIFLGQNPGFRAGRFNVDATGTISTSGTLQVLAGNYNKPIGSVLQPAAKSFLANGTGGAVLDGPRSVFVSGNYAYLASFTSGALEIVNISDPINPVHKSSLSNGTGGALLAGAHGVFVSGNYAYVAANTSDALEIVDVSDPANPTHKGSIINGAGGALLNDPVAVFVSGNYAYVVAQTSNALEIVDISNTANPVHKGSVSLSAFASAVYVSGKYAYIANGSGDSLDIIDISNPSAPVRKGSLTSGTGGALLDDVYSIFVSGNYAYLTGYVTNNLEIVDVSNPTSPTHAGSVVNSTLLGGARSVFVSGNYAYVGSDNDYLAVIDVSSSTAPVITGSIANGNLINDPYSIFVSGNYAYVASDFGDDLGIVDVSGAVISNAQIGSLNADTVQVRNIAQFNQGLLVKDGLSVGGATQLFGDVSIGGGRATTTNMGGGGLTVSVNQTSSTFTSRIFDVSGATGFIFNSGTSTLTASNNRNLVSFQSGGVDKFLFAADGSIVINKTAGTFDLGKFYVDSSGNVSASGTFAATGLSRFTSGFISNASSSIGSSLNVSGNLNASSSFFANGLSTLLSGFISNASSSVGAGLQVAGALNASSSLFVSSSIFLGQAAGFQAGRFNVDATGTISTSGTLQVLAGNYNRPIGSVFKPMHVGSISNGAGGAALSLPERLFVAGDYAYVPSFSSAALEILDVSNPSNPVHKGSLSNGSGGAVLSGASAVFVAGNYAYVAASSGNALEIVDVSNPASPVHKGWVSVSGPTDVFVAGNYAYVVTGVNNTLEVIDVSDPANPVRKGALSHGTGGALLDAPQGVYVAGKYAYVASYTSQALEIVDISNPTSPVHVGAISSTTAAVALNGAQTVRVSGNYAYVASVASDALEIIDVSNPTSPTHKGKITNGTGGALLSSPYGVAVAGNYAYVAANGSNALEIIDISSSTAPVHKGSIAHGAGGAVLTGASYVFVSGNYAYVSALSAGAVEIVDVSGAAISNAQIGSLNADTLQIRSFAQFNQGLLIKDGLNVGGATRLFGDVSIGGGRATTTNAGGGGLTISTSLATTTFTSFASGTTGIGAFVFDTKKSFSAASSSILLSVRNAGSKVFSVGTDGYVAASGTFNANVASASIGDFAEYIDLASGEAVEPGDVVVIAPTGLNQYKKSTSANSAAVAGVISDTGAFVIGSDGEGRAPLAMAGLVYTKVTDENGPIIPGDALITASKPGYAMRYDPMSATTTVGIIGTAAESFAKGEGKIKVLVRGSLASGSPLNVNVGGTFTMSAASLNQLFFSTTTVSTSAIGNTASARAFIFNADNFDANGNSDQYLLSLRSHDTPVFSVSQNGDVHAKGNYFGASAVLGTSTNPGDLAERVDIALDDQVEAGDVVVVDPNAPDTYRRSGGAYDQSVAGVISTNPTIVVGNGKTNYTGVLAMVGRVPVKISAENGVVNRGDLLVSASKPGFAMKYDPIKDGSLKMVGVIGVALEPFATGTGKIMALIRTGWAYSQSKNITTLQSNVQEIAAAAGIILSGSGSSSTTPGNLSVANQQGSLMYQQGDLNLDGHMLLSVASISGKDNRWTIDGSGHFITRFATVAGEKIMFAMQSPTAEFVFSSSSQLIAGEAAVTFDAATQAIIDPSQPLKVTVTLTSGEAKGVYVSAKSASGFTVKELGGGTSSASFDWVVVAKRQEGDTSGQSTIDGGGTITPGSGEEPGPPTSTPPTDPGTPTSTTSGTTDGGTTSSTLSTEPDASTSPEPDPATGGESTPTESPAAPANP